MVCSAYCRFLRFCRYRFQLRPAPYGRFLRSSRLQKPIYENHVCPLCSDDSCFHTARCFRRRKFPGRFAGKSTVRLRIPCGASSGKISFHPHQLRLRRSRRFFLPLLVIGALIGSLEGELLISAGILSALYLPNIIIIAMVAFFAASIRAPITGTLLILEMTGDFHHLTALALASAVAYVTAELLKGQPIYDSLLKKSLSNGSTPVSDEERNILEIPVGSGSILENRTVEEIPRLSHTVLVNIKRQGADMIPDPDTKLLSGDFLYFLTESRHTEEIHHSARHRFPKTISGKLKSAWTVWFQTLFLS